MEDYQQRVMFKKLDSLELDLALRRRVESAKLAKVVAGEGSRYGNYSGLSPI